MLIRNAAGARWPEPDGTGRIRLDKLADALPGYCMLIGEGTLRDFNTRCWSRRRSKGALVIASLELRNSLHGVSGRGIHGVGAF